MKRPAGTRPKNHPFQLIGSFYMSSMSIYRFVYQFQEPARCLMYGIRCMDIFLDERDAGEDADLRPGVPSQDVGI